MRTQFALAALAAAVVASTAGAALTVTASSFDQVAALNLVGASVTQIGAGNPGGVLLNSGGFVGAPNTLSGVSVVGGTLAFPVSSVVFADVGPTQVGNIASVLTGAPTDITFTLPGPGGPDGTVGDGSFSLSSGDIVGVGFAAPITALAGSTIDLFVFTNTDGAGTGDIGIYLGGLLIDSISGVFVPGGAAGSGTGGLAINIPDGLVFDAVRVRGATGNLEIDAIGAIIPAPSAAALLGLSGLVALRRRR